MKALKLEGRHDREAFKPHIYEIDEGNVVVSVLKKEHALEIGKKLKEMSENKTRLEPERIGRQGRCVAEFYFTG
jgi:hypothetical protein